jgi:hypothetical protein
MVPAFDRGRSIWTMYAHPARCPRSLIILVTLVEYLHHHPCTSNVVCHKHCSVRRYFISGTSHAVRDPPHEANPDFGIINEYMDAEMQQDCRRRFEAMKGSRHAQAIPYPWGGFVHCRRLAVLWIPPLKDLVVSVALRPLRSLTRLVDSTASCIL